MTDRKNNFSDSILLNIRPLGSNNKTVDLRYFLILYDPVKLSQKLSMKEKWHNGENDGLKINKTGKKHR